MIPSAFNAHEIDLGPFWVPPGPLRRFLEGIGGVLRSSERIFEVKKPGGNINTIFMGGYMKSEQSLSGHPYMYS